MCIRDRSSPTYADYTYQYSLPAHPAFLHSTPYRPHRYCLLYTSRLKFPDGNQLAVLGNLCDCFCNFFCIPAERGVYNQTLHKNQSFFLISMAQPLPVRPVMFLWARLGFFCRYNSWCWQPCLSLIHISAACWLPLCDPESAVPS